MGERKEYLLIGLPDEIFGQVISLANEELGESFEISTFEDMVPGGPARIWQPDERCVTTYPRDKAFHGSEIDTDSKIGKLLEELSKQYPSDDSTLA